MQMLVSPQHSARNVRLESILPKLHQHEITVGMAGLPDLVRFVPHDRGLRLQDHRVPRGGGREQEAERQRRGD